MWASDMEVGRGVRGGADGFGGTFASRSTLRQVRKPRKPLPGREGAQGCEEQERKRSILLSPGTLDQQIPNSQSIRASQPKQIKCKGG